MQEPVHVAPEPGHALALGAPPPALIVKDADMKGELAKQEASGTAGALATRAIEHAAKTGALRFTGLEFLTLLCSLWLTRMLAQRRQRR